MYGKSKCREQILRYIYNHPKPYHKKKFQSCNQALSFIRKGYRQPYDCVVDASTHLLILFLNGPTIRSSHGNKWQGSNLGRGIRAKYSIIELYIIETNIEGSKGCNLSFAR